MAYSSQHDATRICCWAPVYQPDSDQQPAPALSSKPAARRCYCRSNGQTDGRTDGRTPYRYVDPVAQLNFIFFQTLFVQNVLLYIQTNLAICPQRDEM